MSQRTSSAILSQTSSSEGEDGTAVPKRTHKPLSQTKLNRASSLRFDDSILSKPLDIRNLNVPKLPRQQTLQRTVERERDWTGAPQSPFVPREESERDTPVTHVESGFQVLPAGSPLRLTLAPPSYHTNHCPPPLNPTAVEQWRPTSPASTFVGDYGFRPLYGTSVQVRRRPRRKVRGIYPSTPGAFDHRQSLEEGWAHTQGPATPKIGTGGRGAPFVAAATTTRYGRPAHYTQMFRGSPMNAQQAFPTIRQMPPPLPMKFTSPLAQATSLEHRNEIMREHGIEAAPAYSGPGVESEEEEGRSKLAVLKLKPYIKDTHATLTWEVEQPLKKWKRVRTDPAGARVTGLSLVSTKLEGDLEELGPLFAQFEHLELLLIHSNAKVTGDISWLCTLFKLKELRISAGRMRGDITGFSALIDLTKLVVYNRKKEDLKGLAEDLRSQMPKCSIDVDIKTHNGI